MNRFDWISRCAIPSRFVEALCAIRPLISELPEHKRMFLALMAWTNGRYRHSCFGGFDTIGYETLDYVFGRRKFQALNEAIGMFEVTPFRYGKGGFTRGYALVQDIREMRDEYMRNKPFACEMVPVSRRPIISTSSETQAGSEFNKSVAINVSALEQLHSDMVAERRATQDAGRGAFLDYRIGFAHELLAQAYAGGGSIKCEYTFAKTGRYCATGFSLQCAPREVRSAALAGWYDYDIECCHPAILVDLAAKEGYDAARVRAYVENKDAVRKAIAKRVGIPVADVKTAFLAVMLGASTRISEKAGERDTSIAAEIGREQARRLFNDREFNAFVVDVRGAFEAVLSSEKYSCEKFTNAAGFVVESKDKASKMAAILQGIEVCALRAAASVVEIEVPVHDGFVTKTPINTEAVELAIFEKTGIRLALSVKKIESPAAIEQPKDLAKNVSMSPAAQEAARFALKSETPEITHVICALLRFLYPNNHRLPKPEAKQLGSVRTRKPGRRRKAAKGKRKGKQELALR